MVRSTNALLFTVRVKSWSTMFRLTFIMQTELRSPFWNSESSSNLRLLMLNTPIVPSPLQMKHKVTNIIESNISLHSFEERERVRLETWR